MKHLFFLAAILSAALSLAAEAPTAGEIEARLATVQAKREKLLSDFKAAEMMMRLAPLEDAQLRETEKSLTDKLAELKKAPAK